MQNGPFDYKVSQTRQASDEVVFTAERPNISFVMWNEEGFAKLSEIVFQCYEWEAKNLISGQKYVVVMTILKRAT